MRGARGGWSIIELAIVVAVIAILTAISLPGLVHLRARAQEATVARCLRQIAAALEKYRWSQAEGLQLYPTEAMSDNWGALRPWINQDLMDGEHVGFRFRYSPSFDPLVETDAPGYQYVVRAEQIRSWDGWRMTFRLNEGGQLLQYFAD